VYCLMHHIVRVVLNGVGLLLVLLRRIVASLLVSHSRRVARVLLRTVGVSLLKRFIVMVRGLLYTSLFCLTNNIFIVITKNIFFFFLVRNSPTIVSLVRILVSIFGVGKRRRLREWSVVIETCIIGFHSIFERLFVHLRLGALVRQKKNMFLVITMKILLVRQNRLV
jgi:hypothetical protein